MAHSKTMESKTIPMVDESKRCNYHSGDYIMVANVLGLGDRLRNEACAKPVLYEVPTYLAQNLN